MDYLSDDYPGAVERGEIVNPTEYREMLDFAQNIQQLAGQLPAGERKNEIIEATDRLRDLIGRRADNREISRLSAELRHWLINGYALPATPADPPDLQLATRLYDEQCASCHGVGGRVDSPLARTWKLRPSTLPIRDATAATSFSASMASLPTAWKATSTPSIASCN